MSKSSVPHRTGGTLILKPVLFECVYMLRAPMLATLATLIATLSASCSSGSQTSDPALGGDGDGDGDSASVSTGGQQTSEGSGGQGNGGSGTGGEVSRPPIGPPPVVTLYPECDHQGTSTAYTVGDYDSAALTESGLTPGAIASLRVTAGYKAILYTHDSFLGETVTLTANDTCLNDFSVASLRVRENLGETVNTGTGGENGGEPGPPPCTSNTPPAETCEPFGVLLAGKYWVNNNLWGQDAGVGEQCVRRTCQDGDAIAWETDWSWMSAPSSVKSYASAILGWHWGYHVQETGLPVRASENRSVTCGFTYTVSQTGTMNVAYDLWFHSVPDPEWGREGFPTDQPTDELMIWLYRDGGAGPLGTVQGPAVSIGGASWNLYRGQIISDGEPLWNVYSFVRTTNTSSSTLDLTEFANEVVSRGWMPNTRYLTSVQAGPEVFVGEGSLNTTSFGCSIAP